MLWLRAWVCQGFLRLCGEVHPVPYYSSLVPDLVWLTGLSSTPATALALWESTNGLNISQMSLLLCTHEGRVKRFVFVSIKWNIFHTKILHIESFSRRSLPKQRYKWGWEKVYFTTWVTSKQSAVIFFFLGKTRECFKNPIYVYLFFLSTAKLPVLFNRVRFTRSVPKSPQAALWKHFHKQAIFSFISYITTITLWIWTL